MSKRGAMILLACIFLSTAGSILVYRALADHDSNFVTYYPSENDTVLHNPYTGFVADARYPKIEQPVQLAFAKMTWREIEPRKGEYDFESFESHNNWAEWKSRNAKIVIRLVLDDPRPEYHLDIPDWLYEVINGEGTRYDIEHGKGFSPDYGNGDLIRHHADLIRALGERYNNDPMVAFVQLGSIGHWAEWHTWDREPDLIPFPKRAITDQYVLPYLELFDRKHLLMRRPMKIAADHGMGLFNDAFGQTDDTVEGFLDWYTNGYTSWLTEEKEPAMPEFWVHSPSGGEFSDATAYLEDGRIEETIRQAKLTHVSWLGPNSPVKEPVGGPLQPNIDRFLKTIGYRFVVISDTHEESTSPGSTLHVRLKVGNRGVAPFYFPWKFELSLSNSDGDIVASVPSEDDIRNWVPGEHEFEVEFPLPDPISPGLYTLNASILDPETGEPGIAFANDGRRPDGRYSLGTVQIGD